MSRAALLLCLVLITGCAESSLETDLGDATARGSAGTTESGSRGRLYARPGSGNYGEVEPGMTSLGLERPTLLYVPPDYRPDEPAPFMLLLHGAGAGATNQMKRLRDAAEDRGIVLLAVKSEASTWDRTSGEFGPDVDLIDDALTEVFERYAIDRRHVAIEGFSDGASYALSLGLTNGDLFTHVIAFSAGFVAPEETRGSPAIWVSHGTSDPILPIESTARDWVPRLESAGYDVTFVEFPGGHLAAPRIRQQAVDWFLR